MELSTARRVIGRKFIDAPQGERCRAVVTLKDGTTADCGRRAMTGDLCTQHAGMTKPGYPELPDLAISVLQGVHCETQNRDAAVAYLRSLIAERDALAEALHRIMAWREGHRHVASMPGPLAMQAYEALASDRARNAVEWMRP